MKPGAPIRELAETFFYIRYCRRRCGKVAWRPVGAKIPAGTRWAARGRHHRRPWQAIYSLYVLVAKSFFSPLTLSPRRGRGDNGKELLANAITENRKWFQLPEPPGPPLLHRQGQAVVFRGVAGQKAQQVDGAPGGVFQDFPVKIRRPGKADVVRHQEAARAQEAAAVETGPAGRIPCRCPGRSGQRSRTSPPSTSGPPPPGPPPPR